MKDVRRSMYAVVVQVARGEKRNVLWLDFFSTLRPFVDNLVLERTKSSFVHKSFFYSGK